ncbi:alpha/beta fold hydrolase [Bordetella pertussis]|uniref:alpha/beta fold hydrolase n=1 Tax=Bordetella pertussis TaxID=520 RepID=UPI0005DB7677|nr:alpha/beta hydrolase [Bordetella pertussis]CPK90933.1 hydrolase-like protein [Bordetella pertussis]
MTPPARSSAAAPAQYADVHYADRPMRIEYALLAPERRDAPLLVFLHEGLGSLAMWRDWPRRVCDAAGCRGLVYSRYGYGRSTVRPLDESRPIDYLHQQAAQALPALFAALGIDARRDKPVLFGHSDGASIALLYAALCPDAVAGIAVAAPHIYVEDITVANIAVALRAYRETTLRDRLARYHDDVDSTFASRGPTPGWTRPSGNGTSRPTCRPSPARCWPCRAWTTNTARWNRSAASAAWRRRPACWKSRTAATRRTRTSPSW